MTVMAHINRKSVSRLIVMLMTLTLLMSACARSGSTDESSQPVAQPGDANGSQTDTTTLPTPAPTPTSAGSPATDAPKPAPTTPAPAAPVSQPPAVSISCTISPQQTVKVGEYLTYTAVQSPTNASVNYTFDHGDGTLDHTSVSKAYYEAPGVYAVKLRWSHAGGSGTILCGSVTVDGFVPTTPPVFNAADYIGKSRTQAEAIATQKGLVSRVIRIDTETFPVTYDYRTDRVNLSIDYGVVTGATVG